MKFSALSTVITFLVYSNVSYAQTTETTAPTAPTCVDHISNSQSCVSQCLYAPPTKIGSVAGNLLIECKNQVQVAAVDLTYDGLALEDCCGMIPECKISMAGAGSCLTSQLPTVKSTSQDYLGCIYKASRTIGAGGCSFAGFCVNAFTGGFGVSGSTNNFDVGKTGDLAALTRGANSCDDMTSLYLNACDNAKCCTECQAKIAEVVSAVTNELLLPAYNKALGNAEKCDTLCDDVLSASPSAAPAIRKLEGESSTTVTTSTSAEDNAEVVELATECNDGLKLDIVVYNQTYAVDNFFECLGKKVGQIVANADTDAMIATQETQKESTSSSISISSSMMLVMSAIASVIINY